ncbi:MAG: DNA-binding domain-containing protein [Rhodobacterales bacterium]|nr:DNA-binding domain-containing protein [Rhodobacterales bacterium]
MRQADFVRALLDPEAAVPAGLVDPKGRPAPKRFSVYRNNVAASLTRALEASFPTVRKLVGEAFFAAMAGVFLRAHPPQSRILMLYGDEFPGFLEGFPPAAGLGYLPDVARLDQVMRESYHAADSQPLPEAEFQHLLRSDIAALRLELAPSLRLVRSRWPVVSIWTANAEGGPAPGPDAEDALILRPDFDPRPHLLPRGGGAFVQGLLDGLPLGESLDLAASASDLPEILSLLISGRAIVGVKE